VLWFGKKLGACRKFSCLYFRAEPPPSQIVKAFGVPMTTVKRCCRAFRERGAAAFFKAPARREGHRLTAERVIEVQRLLDQGWGVPQISKELNILPSTLHKAIDDGRLKRVKKKTLVAKGR
jgi:hypothetical protein